WGRAAAGRALRARGAGGSARLAAPAVSQDLLELSAPPADAARRRGRHGAQLRVAACLAVVVLALGWVAIRGLTGNFVYYLTPADIVAHHKAQVGQRIRLGGYVVPGSVHRAGSLLMFTVPAPTPSLQP